MSDSYKLVKGVCSDPSVMYEYRPLGIHCVDSSSQDILIFPSNPDRLSKMSQHGTLCCACHNLICPGFKDQFPIMCNS